MGPDTESPYCPVQASSWSDQNICSLSSTRALSISTPPPVHGQTMRVAPDYLLNGPETGVGKYEQRHHCVPIAEMATVLTAANRDSVVNCSACCRSQIQTQEGRQPGHRDSLSHDKIWTLRRGLVTCLQQSLTACRVTTSKTMQPLRKIMRDWRCLSLGGTAFAQLVNVPSIIRNQ